MAPTTLAPTSPAPTRVPTTADAGMGDNIIRSGLSPSETGLFIGALVLLAALVCFCLVWRRRAALKAPAAPFSTLGETDAAALEAGKVAYASNGDRYARI